MGWTLSFERVCLVCQRIWRENHHWFVTSKHCCCCYWSIYNAFFFFPYCNISPGYQGPSTRFVWRILSPNHVRSLITKACLVIRDFSKTSVQIENSGLITKMNKKQMRFHLTFNLEKKPCCYRVNLGRPLSTQISFWVQDWNSRQYDSFTLWEIDDAPFSTFC